jgi:hypothetical protein
MDSKGTEWSQIWSQFFDIKSPKSNITLLTILKKVKMKIRFYLRKITKKYSIYFEYRSTNGNIDSELQPMM